MRKRLLKEINRRALSNVDVINNLKRYQYNEFLSVLGNTLYSYGKNISAENYKRLEFLFYLALHAGINPRYIGPNYAFKALRKMDNTLDPQFQYIYNDDYVKTVMPKVEHWMRKWVLNPKIPL